MKSISIEKSSSFYRNRNDSKTFLRDEGEIIERYSDLRRKVAELSCLYPQYTLFYRGQRNDHKDEKTSKSTLLPNLFRNNPSQKELAQRWEKLDYATKLFDDRIKTHPDYKKAEFEFLRERHLAKWSVMQHYEVVDTPLLDVTQSLRVACSFADLGRVDDYAFIYVLALPYPTGRISIHTEELVTNIRLLSVTPSSVMRPHNQEGFLIADDFITPTDKVDESMDFSNRVIAKYKIHLGSEDFWKVTSELSDRPLSEEEIYPDKVEGVIDKLADICEEIKSEVCKFKPVTDRDPASVFINLWILIERYLLGLDREFDFQRKDRPTVSRAIHLIRAVENHKFNCNPMLNEVFTPDSKLSTRLYSLRNNRNKMIHEGIDKVDIREMIRQAEDIKTQLEKIPSIDKMAEVGEFK